MTLLSDYRAVHTQAALPIFVQDELDSRMLVEACVEAGLTCIEYTQRRADIRTMIPWIRKQFPDLRIIVGSTIDSDQIVRAQRRRYPQLMTLAEIADLDVHGFISMIGWTPESIARYSQTHLVMPSAGTVNEAFYQVHAGAHMIKFHGQLADVVRRTRGTAAFDYCPIIVTGGISDANMQATLANGAVMTATGFDLMLKGLPEPITRKVVVGALRRYADAAAAARLAVYPDLAAADAADDATWLATLPHYHPFG